MRNWILLALTLWGCNFNELHEKLDGPVDGFKPEYGNPSTSEIKLLSPQTVKDPGKIYIYGKYLLVNEKNRGIHIFDNVDKTNPQPVAFAEILGNTDMAIKDAVLFADHMGNLSAIRINNFENLEPIGSLPINGWLLGVPPPSGHYFECIDQSKGLVVAWKESEIPNQNCYAPTTSGW